MIVFPDWSTACHATVSQGTSLTLVFVRVGSGVVDGGGVSCSSHPVIVGETVGPPPGTPAGGPEGLSPARGHSRAITLPMSAITSTPASTNHHGRGPVRVAAGDAIAVVGGVERCSVQRWPSQ